MNNKSSYQYLQEFCKIKSRSSFDKRPDPITTRVQYLLDQLSILELEVIQDIFPPNENFPDENYINLYVKFESKNPEAESVVFLAHHDIANPYSENCQDNSASVCNLLNLCSLLKEKELERNVIIVFTDGEEPASFRSGAGHLANLINDKKEPFNNVAYTINLELTGVGKIIWMDSEVAKMQLKTESKLILFLQQQLSELKEVGTPFNDCYSLRHFGVDSICIGSFTEKDLNDYNDKKYPTTWRLCHSPTDTIDKISEEDMLNFVNDVLLKLI